MQRLRGQVAIGQRFKQRAAWSLNAVSILTKDEPITIDKATIKEKPAIGYYIAAVAILIAGLGGLIWFIGWLKGFMGYLHEKAISE